MALRAGLLEMLGREQLCEVVNQLVDTISTLSFNAVMGLSPALQLVKGSASIQGFAVEDIDPSKIERLCGLVGLGRDASFESKCLGDRGTSCC